MGFSALAQTASTKPAAKELVTDTFTVAGNCTMCKARIEGAMDLRGVKSASWSPATKLATVSYYPARISEEEIKKSVAGVGHDVPGYPGNDKAYSRLHECCKHRTAAK
jgi:copper chaperone CopZ